MHGFSDRLRIERERLGYSQRKLAAALGITQQTQFKYEKSQSVPNLDYLDAIQELGFNVQYVLGFEGPDRLKDSPLKVSDVVELSVKAFKEVELSNLDEDGIPLSLGVRMREFRRNLEGKTETL